MRREAKSKKANIWKKTDVGRDSHRLMEEDREHVEWIGLVRYNDDGEVVVTDEYAKVEESILAEITEVTYYVDDAGLVGVDSHTPEPVWGLDIHLHKSSINYGPWTNRQRTPSLTAIPGNGYHRLHRKFALVFKFHDSCTFKVPFREKSKDSKFSDESLKSEMKLAQYGMRLPGFFEFAFNGEDSVLAFDIPMVTAATGYVTTLSARFKSVVLTSSLNSWEVLVCDTFQLECQMKSPLKWNGERVWEYDIEVSKGKLHYLQDHIQLLKDVFSDISYSTVPHIGPYFIPIAYQLSISVIDIDLYCCINRQNVQSNKLEENCAFPSGRVTVNLPFLLAEPLVYGFTFHFQTENASLSISHPASHVIGAFMTESSRNIGSFQSLVIKGNYEYFATQPAIGPDSTNITIEVDSAAIKAYGFTITAFFDFLANYFGEFSNVMNVEEYRLKVSDPDKFKAQRENKIMDSTDIVNDSELWIEVIARDSFVVLPENLFECVSASILYTELISLEMASNMTDMLMKVDADSIICTRTIKMPSLFDVASIRSTFDLARDNEKNAMNIQGLDVSLRSLYGPKPDFLVYASEVAITINLIEGEVSPGFLGGIQTSLKMILHHTTDADNSLPEDSTEPIQYLKVKLKKLLVHVWCKDAVIVCEMPLGAKLQSDSLVTSRWISRILVDVPAVTIKLLEESFEAWEEVFNLSLPLSACILASTDDLRAKKLEQRSFVSAQDHTLRCKHLLHRNHEPTPPFFNIPIDFKFDEDMNDALLESPSQIHSQGKFVGGRESSLRSKTNRAYVGHLRRFKYLKTPAFCRFETSDGDLVFHEPLAERHFPHEDLELLNNAELTDSIPHTKVILRSSDSANILITPVALIVLQRIFEVDLKIELSESSIFDSIQVFYTALVHKANFPNFDNTTIILSASQIRAQLIQECSGHNDARDLPENERSFENRYASLCSIDLHCSKFLQVLNYGRKYLVVSRNSSALTSAHYSLDLGSFRASVRQFGKNVVGIPQFKLFRAAFDAFPKNSVISDFLCCDLKLQGDFEEATSNHPGSIALNLQSQSYETIATKESAEVLLNAFATWTAAWNAAYGSAIMFLEKAQRKVQDLIEVVVQESLNRSIFGDALFLTDPSVIWLEGRDFRKHQKDAGWKFLMRQRYSAMKIGHTALENALLRFANQFPNKRNLLQDVLPQIKKWAGFRDERADSAKNVLLSFIFTSKNVDETWEFTRFLSQHNISAFGTVEATKFSTFEVGNGENILEVNPFLLDFNATSRQDDHKPNSSFADISVFMSSSHAKFSLVPDIFGWLRIFDRFQNGMKSNSNSQIYTDINFESAISTNFAVMFSVVLENVSVLANAGSLIMKTEFSELSANGNYFNTSGLCDTGENMKVFGNVVGRSVKCEFIDSSNANLTNLLHLSINSIICNVINNTTLFGFGEIEVILPKSLIKLQQFFEHWRDSVPDLDFAVNAVKASLEKHSSGAASPISRKLYTFSSFQFVVNRLILVSDLLQSFRCEYTASKLILLAKTNPVNRERNVLGRIGSHKIEFFVPDSTSANRSFYALPEAIFEFDITFADVPGPTVDGSLFLGIFGGVFDVNLLEQMMNFRSRVFSEINEILDSNAFSPQSLLRKNPKTVQRKNFSYKLKIKIAGADVTGLGPESKFLLSSDLFTVDVTNWSSDEKKINDLLEELRWKFSLEDCSLSLITNSAETSKIRATLSVENGGGSFIGERGEEEILVNVKEVNGVLHPEFPSKIISFLVHYSTRLSDDHLMASQEVFILRRNAKKLVSSVPIAGEKDRDFLRDNALEVQIGHIGIAFPFSNDAMSRSSALLLCIEKVKYESFRFQENQGVIESASLQFVEQFDPETEKSFRATNYSVTNRFLLRRINGTVFQNFTEGYGTVKVDAGVDGFDLELNSRIASHVNDLIAIYSKQRDVFGTSTASSTLLKPSQQFSMPQAFTEFVLNADLIIGPGKCSINSASSEAGVQEDESSKIQEESFEQQIFRFPRLSLSVNGTTIFGDDSKAASRVKRSVYITQHIFESENVLHPTLVSFFLNVASTINLDNFSSPMVTADVPSVSNFETQKHDVTYLLKLSQTKVSLSCLPESKVSLNCALEEANLLVTFDPSAENSGMNSINVTFNMKDANGVLRHTFSPEDCFRLSVSDLSLAGSIMFSGESRNYLLALNSSDVSAALNVRQLHDLFLFQRLWVSPLVPKTVSQQSVDSSETYAALLRLPGHSTSNGKFHDTFHLRALLPSISLSADMGHSIGKASFVISDFFTGISLSWSNESFGAKRLSTSMSNIRLYGDGRYSGEAIVVNPGFWVVSTNDFDTKTEGTISSGLFAAEKIEVQLQFQYERVLVVNIQPADFMFSQSWIDYDGDSTLCTNLIIDIESMKGILSRRTLPTLIQLIEKIKIVIAEKMNLDLSYSPETPRASRAQTSVSLRPSNSEYSLQADTLFRRVLWYKDGAKNIGRARINIKSSLVNFMRYNFRDPDFAKMVAKEIVISLSHFAQQEALLEEKLEVDLGGIAIKKGTSRSLTPEEERVWTPPEWFTFLGSSPSKNVAVIPAVSVTLNSLSDLLANKVQLGGSTFFASQIDIALNFGLYKFLLELFEFYDSAFKKSGLNLQSLPDREETDSRAQVDIEYETIGFRFDPQLKVTGEATPKELIEWLGVNKTRIPEMLYLNLCEKLSNVIVWVARNN
ncbi:hypothetical protein HDU83_003932 [Entophlyctis luteolus]|nr:hypothetical protein HDU83_003932 [Entophlyctis luteolus]